MNLGIFAKTFPRRTFTETLDVVSSHGFQSIQFNFSCVGLPTLPATIDASLCHEIQRECLNRNIVIAGVSGTFNLIDPNVTRRQENLGRLKVLTEATRAIGAEFITLCTGTRDPEDMWRGHPDNSSPQAWRDLLASMEQALAVAERHNVVLGVEPEIGNVVSSTRKARQLLDELQSRHVKIVIDPANLFDPGATCSMQETIREVFQLLGTDIAMAHAKELGANGTAGSIAPGQGVLDWNYYFDTLARVNFSGPIILHGLSEADVPQAARFLRSKLSD